jgi:hypothetical protein
LPVPDAKITHSEKLISVEGSAFLLFEFVRNVIEVISKQVAGGVTPRAFCWGLGCFQAYLTSFLLVSNGNPEKKKLFAMTSRSLLKISFNPHQYVPMRGRCAFGVECGIGGRRLDRY